jgi:hypothetical protein
VIAGAVVGGIAGLAILAGLLWFWRRKHNRQKRGVPFLSPTDGHDQEKTDGRPELSSVAPGPDQDRKQAEYHTPQELGVEYNSPQELNAENSGRLELSGDQTLRRELPA